MMRVFRYPAAQAAIRAGMSRLLPENVWPRLLETTRVETFLDLLNGTPYRDALVGTPASVEEIERDLEGYAARLFHMPIKFLPRNARNLVDWLWRHYEVDNLITLLRAAHHHEPPPRIRASLVPLGAATDLNWHAMSLADSLDAVIDWLRASDHGGFYALALEQASGEYQRRGEVFVLEVALYLAYYRRLLYLMDKLSGREGRDARLFIGTVIDGRNLIWAYRYRIFFGLSAEEILGYTLHRAVRVDAAAVRRIATGAPLPEMARRIWNGRLPETERLENLPEEEALVELEIVLERRLYGLARRELDAFSFGLGSILAYLVLVESEVDDISSILEGTAFRWPDRRILPFLIGPRERR